MTEKKKKLRCKYFYETFKSINKTMLISLTAKKNPKINRDHVYSVIHILIEELEEEIFKNKTFEVGNFFKINLFRVKAKKGRNYYTGEIITTKPYNTIKMSLNDRLGKKLMQHFDTELFFKENEPENEEK